MFRSFIFLATLITATSGGGKVIYLTTDGHDNTGCGTLDMPCKTIRYAVTQSEPNSKLMLDGSSGPFLNASSEEYIAVKHSLSLSAWKSKRSVIQCAMNTTKLFRVVGRTSNDENSDITTLTLSSIVIKKCQSSGNREESGTISLVNAQLKLNNSDFLENDVLIHHPETTANESCQGIGVYIKNCTFKSNFRPRPFLYGISIFGCRNISLMVEDSSFMATPISVKSTNGTKVVFTRAAFDGNGIKSSSVFLTVSPGDNSISFSQCNITNHLASSSSPVMVSVETAPLGISTVTFTGTRFANNRRQATSGAALSISSRFRKLANLNVRLDKCIFSDNSADDVGGAVHITYVDSVHVTWSEFYNNSGTNGGAIYMHQTYNSTIANTIFQNNSAFSKPGSTYMAKGGAIYADESEIKVIGSNFTNNTANYTGGTLFAIDCYQVTLNSLRMKYANTEDQSSPANQMVFIDADRNRTEHPTVTLVKNIYMTEGWRDANVLFIKGQVYDSNNTLQCAEGHTMGHSILPQKFQPRYYNYVQMGAWCKACPPRTYRLRGHGEIIYSDLQSPFARTSLCKPCPENARCDYGNIRALSNYWGHEVNGVVEMILCPRGQCCNREDICTGYQSCAENHMGFLCTNCAESYEHSLHPWYTKCIPSKSCWSSGAMAGYMISFFVMFFLLLLCHHRILRTVIPAIPEPLNGETVQHDDTNENGNADNTELLPSSEHEERYPQHNLRNVETVSIVCLISVVLFYQLTPIIYPRLTTSTAAFDVFFSNPITELFSFLPPLSWTSACMDKLFHLPLSASRFLATATFFWAFLVFLGFTFLITFVVLRCMSSDGDWILRKTRISVHFGTAFIFLLLYSYVPLLRSGFQAVSCTTLGVKQVGFTDAATTCYEVWQIFIILYMIGCPVFQFLVLESSADLLYKSTISMKSFIFCCIFSVFGFILMCIRFIYQCLQNGNQPVSDDASTIQEQPVSLIQTMVYSILKNPFQSIRFARYSVNGLTMTLFRCFMIVVFGCLLSHRPVLQSLLLTILCIVFLVPHFSKWYVDASAVFETVLLSLLGILSLMNVYASIVYFLGHGETEDSVGSIQTVCDYFCRVCLLLVFPVSLLYFVLRCRCSASSAKP